MQTDCGSNPGETTEFIPDPNETAPEETFPLNVDYQGFYDKNKNDDFVGWLRIEGTKLDYPVMQSSADNANYYLYRDYNGANSSRGSIYAREECDIFTPSDNITMYAAAPAPAPKPQGMQPEIVAAITAALSEEVGISSRSMNIVNIKKI